MFRSRVEFDRGNRFRSSGIHRGIGFLNRRVPSTCDEEYGMKINEAKNGDGSGGFIISVVVLLR